MLGIALIYFAYRFFTAPGFEESVWWGIITLGVLMMQGFIKEWLYARMNMLSVLREVQRLQLQLSMLEKR